MERPKTASPVKAGAELLGDIGQKSGTTAGETKPKEPDGLIAGMPSLRVLGLKKLPLLQNRQIERMPPTKHSSTTALSISCVMYEGGVIF